MNLIHCCKKLTYPLIPAYSSQKQNLRIIFFDLTSIYIACAYPIWKNLYLLFVYDCSKKIIKLIRKHQKNIGHTENISHLFFALFIKRFIVFVNISAVLMYNDLLVAALRAFDKKSFPPKAVIRRNIHMDNVIFSHAHAKTHIRKPCHQQLFKLRTFLHRPYIS